MALPLLPEEDILPVYLSMAIPSTDLNDTEKELVNKFRNYFSRTWLIGKINLSVFIYENATNNGAESYHKSLKPIIKTPHPNVWKFIACLDNVISDYNIELQRLLQGTETTRGANSNTKAKRNSRNKYKEKYLNGTLNPNEYLNSIASTIGRKLFS